ncbi:ABC transporter ATP-binding protein [Candidatus Nanohalovita haloferacivicina]|uniref:ABC transporter ATP-binding protein n=1 Tax=Candidatus Nanohalovita haloferacivicina TaxID=2978046 RepID=UPI00325F9B74|nr:ABC-type multidrug transport system, ATPase component [Candidatus Nanohalobia archaeon BNXNv]
MKAIKAEGLSKSFGDVEALKDLDLELDEGELYGFIGPNGAGKSTTINILTGQLSADSGSAKILGVDPQKHPRTVREKIGILPEREDPPSFLTPREYFQFVGEIRNVDVSDKVEEWAERLKFEEKLDTLNMDLSKGEKQKVMITQAFIHEPSLVFIDEPLTNLDPLVQENVKAFFQEYQEDGNTIFLSTHVLSLAQEVCTKIGVLDQGELIAEHEMDEIGELTDEFLEEVEGFESAQRND